MEEKTAVCCGQCGAPLPDIAMYCMACGAGVPGKATSAPETLAQRQTAQSHNRRRPWGWYSLGTCLFTLVLAIIFREHAPGVILLLGLSLSFVFWRIGQTRRRHLRVRAFKDLLALTPAQFEVEVSNLLFDLGYRRIKRVGRSGDLAADILCRDSKGRSVAVQCKRLAPGSKINSPAIQAFIGMVKIHHKADRGLFVTTSLFTKPARDLAVQHDISLVDGARLSDLVARIRQGEVGRSLELAVLEGEAGRVQD